LINHFLLTRYNVSYASGRRVGIHKDEEWLLARRQLFESWCLPSVVKAAKGINFTWLILCADDSPDALREWLASLHGEHPWIIPIYIEGDTLQFSDYLIEIEQSGVKLGRYILSTRLDSDDAILPHFLRTVQREARDIVLGRRTDRVPEVLNCPLGFQVLDQNLYLVLSAANPFLSVIEDRWGPDPLVSCFGEAHTTIHDHVGAIRQICVTSPSWVQVLHDTNEANELGGLRIPRLFGRDVVPKNRFVENTSPRIQAVRRDLLGTANLLKGCLVDRSVYRASFASRRPR
jgi:hypothetical protein